LDTGTAPKAARPTRSRYPDTYGRPSGAVAAVFTWPDPLRSRSLGAGLRRGGKALLVLAIADPTGERPHARWRPEFRSI